MIAVSNFVLTKLFGTKYVPKENNVVFNSRLKTRYCWIERLKYFYRITYIQYFTYTLLYISSVAYNTCKELKIVFEYKNMHA